MTVPQDGLNVPIVQPQPAPTTVQTGVTPDGRNVILAIYSVNGSTIVFLPAEFAKQVGQQLIDAGTQAATGLIVPSVLPPRMNGHDR